MGGNVAELSLEDIRRVVKEELAKQYESVELASVEEGALAIASPDDVRGIVAEALKPMAATIDAMWRDTVGRLNEVGRLTTLTEEERAEVATAVADRIFSYPPAPDHFGIPKPAQTGTKFQDMIVVALMNQAIWQVFVPAIDEAIKNLLASGYKPKV